MCYIFCVLLCDLHILKPFIYLFEKTFNDYALAKGFVFSLIEVTGGAKIMATSNCFYTLPLLSFSVSFGGLSVILQSLAFLKKAKIKTAPVVFGKLLSAVISFIITVIVLCF